MLDDRTNFGHIIGNIILNGPVSNCKKRQVEFSETHEKLNLHLCLEESVIIFGCEKKNNSCARNSQKYKCIEKISKRSTFCDDIQNIEFLNQFLDSRISTSNLQEMYIEENRNEDCLYINLIFFKEMEIIKGNNLYFYPIPCDKHRRKNVIKCKIISTLSTHRSYVELEKDYFFGRCPDGNF